MPRVTGVAPFFLVADVVRAAEYYRDSSAAEAAPTGITRTRR